MSLLGLSDQLTVHVGGAASTLRAPTTPAMTGVASRAAAIQPAALRRCLMNMFSPLLVSEERVRGDT